MVLFDEIPLYFVFTMYLLLFTLAALYEHFLGNTFDELTTLIKYALYASLGLTLLEAIMRWL